MCVCGAAVCVCDVLNANSNSQVSCSELSIECTNISLRQIEAACFCFSSFFSPVADEADRTKRV